MDNPQYYQPLSHALHPPLVPTSQPPQQPYNYSSHAQVTAANGTNTREEEEEEEDDDEEIVEEELEHREPTHASSHSSPRVQSTVQAGASKPAAATAISTTNTPTSTTQDQTQISATDDDSGKRKPGRPRGSRNRKPRAPPGTSTKAPTNPQHPGFYHYPPPPSGALSPNQQFHEFQWRALNLCSEFYNAAEELIKAASPIVIAQCYQMGPAAKIDPLAMIAEAKRVCDNILANPSQLVGHPVPSIYNLSPYPQMPPPPTTMASTSSSGAATSSVITNPQSFVMPLGNPAMPPPSHAPQPYYPHMYPATAARYPTAPYYSYPSQPSTYYPPPPQPAAPPAQTSPPPPPTTSSTGTISTFNAATGSAAPGGQQGTWSEEEQDRLLKLAEQSREMGGPQNKGEIEWDWVVQQWGNSRTRHQILLKATSMGLKESTTRGTKRRRENDPSHPESSEHNAASQPTSASGPAPGPPTATPTQSQTPTLAAASTPTNASAHAANASPSLQSRRTPSTTPATIAPARTTSTGPWPMPTVAAANTSPILPTSSAQADRNAHYRGRPQAASYGATNGATSNAPYGTAPPTSSASYGAPTSASATSRPPSSHGSSATTHQYMFRPANGPASTGRRDGA
ncbi:uncharacterized protein FIBRA_00163 [Fibroporia radiculosa]|uniref:Myb-like domain-containing protein n=1 Tax=Fibroporia radiculosa TaxID=599839 RepID=J7S5R4_9APHY|nr:uncharacterized protein FIBRA_00163 [Fibroporia radiculosa]CCL98169.1 predicted protein [Fibroporia radiculosa]